MQHNHLSEGWIWTVNGNVVQVGPVHDACVEDSRTTP